MNLNSWASCGVGHPRVLQRTGARWPAQRPTSVCHLITPSPPSFSHRRQQPASQPAAVLPIFIPVLPNSGCKVSASDSYLFCGAFRNVLMAFCVPAPPIIVKMSLQVRPSLQGSECLACNFNVWMLYAAVMVSESPFYLHRILFPAFMKTWNAMSTAISEIFAHM